jgi:hypothetical protein
LVRLYILFYRHYNAEVTKKEMGVVFMSIEWFRDLIIVIFGIGATLAIILLVVLAFILYARLKPIIESVQKTTKSVEKVATSVEEVVAKPLAQVVSFVQGIRNALGLVKRFTGKEEE